MAIPPLQQSNFEVELARTLSALTLNLLLKVLRVPPLMDQSKEVNRIGLHAVIDVEGKWPGAQTRESVRPNMVPTFPPDDFPCLARHSLAESGPKSLRNRAILEFLRKQVALELPAENDLHTGVPKTCSKLSPGSSADLSSARRFSSSVLICSSVLGSPSRLSINSLARSARSEGERESASSTTVTFVSAMRKT